MEVPTDAVLHTGGAAMPFALLIFRNLIRAISARAEDLSSREAAIDLPVQAAELGTQ